MHPALMVREHKMTELYEPTKKRVQRKHDA